tara:strand:+ start:1075 stop:1491 length:417 start_codon:yes stop_codon:yes gene_type:complete
MNVIIKNIDKDNIVINKKDNIYKLYYNLNLYYKIIGIPLKINYKYITVHNNLYYIFINEKDNLNLLLLNNYLLKHIDNFLFIRNNITNKFIICNNYNKNNVEIIKNDINKLKTNNTIYVNINKIKYIKNNNIPIINIL